MGYNAFTGHKRPAPDASVEPTVADNSAEDDRALIAKIIAFAQNDAHEAWIGLGLNSVPIPKVVIEELTLGDKGTLTMNKKGKPKLITLSSQYQQIWTEIEYAQVFIMEMGNVKKHGLHQAVYNRIESMTKLEYVKAIETIEWDFLDKFLKYVDAPTSPFLGHSVWKARPKDFDDYFLNYTAGHREGYEEEWEEYNTQ